MHKVTVDLDDPRLLETLAALEHDQWTVWAAHMMANADLEHFGRWERQCRTHYKDLTEDERESDREWAKRVIAVLKRYERDTLLPWLGQGLSDV